MSTIHRAKEQQRNKSEKKLKKNSKNQALASSALENYTEEATPDASVLSTTQKTQ